MDYINDINQRSQNALSDRVFEILARHTSCTNPIEETMELLREMLEPTPNREDMIYRYEHSLRVARIGEMIAKESGFDVEPIVIGCLLHDVGYRECKTLEELHNHQIISANIARLFLENIRYDENISKKIVRGVKYHNLTDKLPDDITDFEMTIRDSDDIDRFDIIRSVMSAYSCVHDKNNEAIIANCKQQLEKMNWLLSLPRGTSAARRLMEECVSKRVFILNDIVRQAESGFTKY